VGREASDTRQALIPDMAKATAAATTMPTIIAG
jgi:hypothetical protein